MLAWRLRCVAQIDIALYEQSAQEIAIDPAVAFVPVSVLRSFVHRSIDVWLHARRLQFRHRTRSILRHPPPLI